MKTKFAHLTRASAIVLASPVAPLRAQFAYVTNINSNNVSACSIGSDALPGLPLCNTAA